MNVEYFISFRIWLMIIQKDWDFVLTNNMKCEIYFVFWRMSEFYELCDDWVNDMILYFWSWKRTIHICANCSMPGFFNLVEFFGICMNFNFKKQRRCFSQNGITYIPSSIFRDSARLHTKLIRKPYSPFYFDKKSNLSRMW